MSTALTDRIGEATGPESRTSCIAVVGCPNAGKSTLFNALTGLRSHTANFPGTTIERQSGRARIRGTKVEFLDLPGCYSLNPAVGEERVVQETLLGQMPGQRTPDAVLLLLDATRLERNLYLASQVMELGLPTVVALNMTDLAERASIRIDLAQLSQELNCPVVPIVARSGKGLKALEHELAKLLADPNRARPRIEAEPPGKCSGCPFKERFDWAERVGASCTGGKSTTGNERTDHIDRVLTHPVVGLAAFAGVMLGLFATIFWLARYPMDWIERGFGIVGSSLGSRLTDGHLESLLVDGVLGGVGGVLVFLPQICILFFLLSLLEDTGYLARAAFVMDRLMRRVGLPGKAFVPMLSAHACAIPATMATRVIDDRRDRLVTMLVLPLLSCSARIPIYALLTAMLFPRRPLLAALVFTLAYAVGVVAALLVALVLKRSILPGETRPLVLELPGYKLPSMRTAMLTTFARAKVFVKNAGSIILVVSMVLWALATFPTSSPPESAMALSEQATVARSAGNEDVALELESRAAGLTAQNSLANSVAGRLGRTIEPLIEPLGFNWQIGVGVISSFAAREVIVSTLSIVYGVGDGATDDGPVSLRQKLGTVVRRDGSPVFGVATCASMLIFYVLAMQCLPTLAVTRRETNSWRWPVFQFTYMSVLAYVAALIVYQSLTFFGVG